MSVSFGESIAYECDLATLHAGCWVNDAVISVYLEFLNAAFARRKENGSPFVLFTPTETVFLEVTEQSACFDIVPQLDLFSQEKDCVLILPLNDTEDLDTPCSGSHWSLLLFGYCQEDRSFFSFHLDSADNYNSAVARALTSKLACLLEIESVRLLTPKNIPQQSNCSDCGVFVCFYVFQILRSYSSSQQTLKQFCQQLEENFETLCVSGKQKQQSFDPQDVETTTVAKLLMAECNYHGAAVETFRQHISDALRSLRCAAME
eukprot:GCRY01002292.1.p1 GENE.GCRY01002292.1~~GCRY01002292.1.p1  ORF type:complete len:262 (+),score=39.75 GCRY01002292.1:700-1485(+)